MADNRKIKNKIRGENGISFGFGMEDDLAAAFSQTRLDELKAAGAIEGDWTSSANGEASSSQQFRKFTSAPLNFVPLTIPETLEAMRRMDLSERATRSMTFHGEALKDAMRNSGLTGDSGKSATENQVEKEESKPSGVFPEDFPGYEVLAQVENMTPEKLLAMSDKDILKISGIGPVTLKEIREYKNA